MFATTIRKSPASLFAALVVMRFAISARSFLAPARFRFVRYVAISVRWLESYNTRRHVRNCRTQDSVWATLRALSLTRCSTRLRFFLALAFMASCCWLVTADVWQPG